MKIIIKIRAKFNGVCAETGKTIVKGEQVAYCTRRSKTFHKTAKRFKNIDKINALRHTQHIAKFFQSQQRAANEHREQSNRNY